MPVTLDHREWDRAVTEYAAASGMTFAESSSRFLLKLSLTASRMAPRASRAAIQAKRNQTPPKLIAWLARRKFGTAPRVSRLYRTDTVKISAKGRLSRRKSKVQSKNSRPTSYTREEAQQLAKKHFGRRLSSVGFVQNFFRAWTGAMRGFGTGGRGVALPGRMNGGRAGATTHMSSPGGSGFKTSFIPASKANKQASVSVAFDFKSNLILGPGEHVRRTERKLQQVLNAAVPEAVRDTQVYVDRKQRELALRYSGGGF